MTRYSFIFFLLLTTTACNLKKSQKEMELLSPDTSGVWIQPGLNEPAIPLWGHKDGIRIGLSPLKGARGLVRIYTPYLGHEPDEVMNYIAFEPIPRGSEIRGLSELEMSTLDKDKRGKRFWSSNDSTAVLPQKEIYPARGVTEEINGEETLTVYLFSESFDNGAKVYIRVRFYESKPYEFEISTFVYEDSEKLDYFITTATMGNKARLRTLFLSDEQKSSLQIWPEYDDVHFTEHEYFSKNEMIQDESGNILFLTSPDEEDFTNTIYAPNTRSNWIYKGKKAAQYWKVFNPDDSLKGVVNGRYAYWGSSAPIPGGISFENFEIITPFVQGQSLLFGISPKDPEDIINSWKSNS